MLYSLRNYNNQKTLNLLEHETIKAEQNNVKPLGFDLDSHGNGMDT